MGEEGKMPEEDLQVKKSEELLRLQQTRTDRVSRNVHYKQNLRDFKEEKKRTGTTASGRVFELMGFGDRDKKARG